MHKMHISVEQLWRLYSKHCQKKTLYCAGFINCVVVWFIYTVLHFFKSP